MIQEFVERFDKNRDVLRDMFTKNPPSSYREVVTAVITILHIPQLYPGSPDPERITEINHGDYQGTLVYVIGTMGYVPSMCWVIGEGGYQPSMYWYVQINYGSCSVCDTLEHIRDADQEQQIEDFMTLALHIVQGLKEMGEGDE